MVGLRAQTRPVMLAALAAPLVWYAGAGLSLRGPNPIAGHPPTMAEAQVEAEWLAAVETDMRARTGYNQTIVRQVIAGRVSLPQAAAALWDANRHDKHFRAILATHFPAATVESQMAANLLVRAGGLLANDPAKRAAVVRRLTDEYRRNYGNPSDQLLAMIDYDDETSADDEYAISR